MVEYIKNVYDAGQSKVTIKSKRNSANISPAHQFSNKMREPGTGVSDHKIEVHMQAQLSSKLNYSDLTVKDKID